MTVRFVPLKVESTPATVTMSPTKSPCAAVVVSVATPFESRLLLTFLTNVDRAFAYENVELVTPVTG